jgi:CRISPR-associated protein Csb3
MRNVELIHSDPENKTASPIEFGTPFTGLRLDWWLDDMAGGKKLKVWAGTMESVKIAKAMQFAMRDERCASPSLFDVGVIAYDPDNPTKKVEPYYFDSRRGPNAHSRDVGFSPNTLSLTTTAFPAVELLCLVGLQRCLPAPASNKRRHVYEYCSWGRPAPSTLLAPIVSGAISWPGGGRYRFENWYRTGQKKHQAFRSAIKLS